MPAESEKVLSAAEYMKAARVLKEDPKARERLRPVRLVLLSTFTRHVAKAENQVVRQTTHTN